MLSYYFIDKKFFYENYDYSLQTIKINVCLPGYKFLQKTIEEILLYVNYNLYIKYPLVIINAKISYYSNKYIYHINEIHDYSYEELKKILLIS